MILSGLLGSGMLRIMPQPVTYFAAAPERVSGAQAGDIVIGSPRPLAKTRLKG